MFRNKSSSLPELKVNLNKYDNFFTKKSHAQQLAMQEEVPEIEETQSQMIFKAHNRAHARNLEVINHKSTLKSKVQSFLTDSRKMGILDHSNTSNRRSLTKISLQAMKPVKTQSQQQLIYLAKIKSELNFYTENNRRTEKQITNKKATMNQLRQKIIFFQQLLSRSSKPKEELLAQRQENIIYIRFETDKLKYVQGRLKQINITMKKKVKDAQNKVKKTQAQAKNMNEIEGIRQAELDEKQYLLRHYDQFEFLKSENMLYKTDKAMKNLAQNQASTILQKQQERIHIMDRHDYRTCLIEEEHQKLTKQIMVHAYYTKMLDSTWTKYRGYYESYEKAEQLIKMHCMDREELVQDSYVKSFEVKKDLQKRIKEKEEQLKKIEARNKELKERTLDQCYYEIEQIEKRLNNMLTQYKSGKKLLKNAAEEENRKYQKSISDRHDAIEKSHQCTMKLKQWIIKCEENLELQVSKRLPLSQHFISLIKHLHNELKNQEPSFKIGKLMPTKILPNGSKSNKTTKRRK